MRRTVFQLVMLAIILTGCASYEDMLSSRDEATVFTAMHAGDVTYTESDLTGDLADLYTVECPNVAEPATTRATLKGAYGSLIFYLDGDEVRCSLLKPTVSKEVQYLPAADAPEGAAMTVNGVPISIERVQAVMDNLPAETPRDDTTLGQVLTSLADEELLRQESRDIVVPEERFTTTKATLMNGLDEDEFRAQVEANGGSIEEFDRLLDEQIRVAMLLEERLLTKDVQISEEDAQDFYTQNTNLFLQSEVAMVRDIVVTSTDAAEEVAQRIPDEDFCALVREYSADTSRVDQCGTYLIPRGVVDPRLEYASFNTPANQTSVVALENEIHLVQTIQVVPPQVVPFPQVSDSIRQDLQGSIIQQRLRTYLQLLRTNADIKVYLS